MELEIEDKLQEIYKNLKIEVKFKDFRKYEINVTINNEVIKYCFCSNFYTIHFYFNIFNLNFQIFKFFL